jgi:L-threonine-O-3-phosphate decarboxylase
VEQRIDRPEHGGNLTWAAKLAGCSPTSIVDFSASINPLGPPASAIAAIQTHLADLVAYPDPHYHQLRIALGKFHALSPEWVLPGNGVAELLTWAGRELAELNVTHLLTPAFSDYHRALGAFGAATQEHSLQEFNLPLSFSRLLQNSQSQPSHAAGLLLNNPHNPSGLMLSREAVLACLERFALVVVDEAFMDFLPPEEQQSVIDSVLHHPNLVVLRSLTKFYSLPGLRLGYAIAHPDRLKRWQQWRDPWTVNALAAAVGQVVVADRAFQQQTWAWLVPTRQRLYQQLAQLPGLNPYAGVANFLLVRSAHSVPELQLELLKRHQILIRDCLSFPELGDRYFRVAVRLSADNDRLISGLIQILATTSPDRTPVG